MNSPRGHFIAISMLKNFISGSQAFNGTAFKDRVSGFHGCYPELVCIISPKPL